MRTRVCARVRTVGALLLVGGAIVGAAVVAWQRRGDGKGAKNDRRGKEDKVLDGGVVENVQRKSDQTDKNLRREDTEVGANAMFQDGKETEELHEVQEQVDEVVVDEVVADELDSRPADKFDPNSSKERAEIIDDTDSGDVRKPDQNSAMSCAEDEITPNVLATEGVKNSDQSALTISSPGIAHEEEHSGHGDGADQEITSTQMAAHQSQIPEQPKVDNKTETSMVKNVSKHEEEKPPAQEPVAPIDSPVSSSLPALLKPAEKKRPANTGLNETGMKLGQDGGSKKGAAKGVAVVSMDRRAASVAILAIIFAVTIGVNVVVRLYSSLRAT